MQKQHTTRVSTQRGSVLIIGTLVLFALMAFMGLAFDASYMFYQKRRMQTAADAGAMAVAQLKYRGNNNTQSATDSARKDAAMNGFTHGVSSTDVAVNVPPTMGSRAGNTAFAEVIVTQPQPTWFMRIVNYNTATVRARSVAGLTNGEACVFALDPDTSNQNNGFRINGTADARFDCGVYSNSNFRSLGSGCIVTSTVSYTGTYDNHNNASGCGPASSQAGVQTTDPFMSMANRLGWGATPPSFDCSAAVPAGTPETSSSMYVIKGKQVSSDNEDGLNDGIVYLRAGVYCGGIQVNGSINTVRFIADSFGRNTFIIVGGGLRLNSGINVDGRGYGWNDGVLNNATYGNTAYGSFKGMTIFNTFLQGSNQYGTYGEVRIQAGTVTMIAPTTGSYRGLLVWQDPRVVPASNNTSSITGTTSSIIQGILYFPSTGLTYSGSSSSTLNGNDGYTILVGWDIEIQGGSKVNSDYSALGLGSGDSPIQIATFVE